MERYIAIKQVSYQEEVSIAGLNVLSLRLFEIEKKWAFRTKFSHSCILSISIWAVRGLISTPSS